MEHLNGHKVRSLLVGLITVIFLGDGRANADFTFGPPTDLGPTVNSSSADGEPYISPNGLELFFNSTRPGGYGEWDIWVTKRQTAVDDWGEPMNLGPLVNSSTIDAFPCLSADGLSLYFCSNRPGGYGAGDVYLVTRESLQDEWGLPVNLGMTINGPSDESFCCVSTDALELYFSDRTPYRVGGCGGRDIWVSRRSTINDSWGEPVNLGSSVNSSSHECAPSISSDGLSLFFVSDRPGGFGNFDLWVTIRRNVSDPWAQPVNLGPIVNSPQMDTDSCISPDGATLYFCSDRVGGRNLWQVPIIPIVDFNCDEVVDSADVCIMIDHWGTDNSQCDIGPMPWGDGIVDVLDLVVLTEYMEPIDRTLIAHWELDEIEGDIAKDSTVGDNDADVFGGPTWQPDGGKTGGALQFDGIDDYLSTPFILNPSEVSFSATAWIKGGAPGQVIISQADVEGQSALESGSTWLGINPSDGRLMTGLMEIYFGPLESESVVTDEQWHHVGLVYDCLAMKRHLYVDGTEVAVDDGIVAGVQSNAGLYIGSGKTLDAGSFISGLIDDVRIYDKALTAEEIAELAQ